MADTRPTQLRFFYKVYLCVLAIFDPKKLIEEEKKDNEKRSKFSIQEEKEHPANIVHRAFWSSLGLIIVFGCVGIIIGFLFQWTLGQPSPTVIIISQVVGASLLLWGTLFVQGWQIQTYCGVTLVERVNLWIYRTLYCAGTSIIISSLVWNCVTREPLMESIKKSQDSLLKPNIESEKKETLQKETGLNEIKSGE